MKAAYIEHTGPPEVILYRRFAQAQARRRPGAGQGRSRGRQPDRHLHPQRHGRGEIARPFIIGCDLAGVVEAVGPEATRFKAGDRVWGSNQGLLGRQGTFAEYAAVDEQWLYPTPEASVNSDAAAAIALVGITAHLGPGARCAG